MYFTDFRDGLDHAELASALPEKPRDVGGEYLPFNHLGDRGLEVLAYHLLRHQHSTRGGRVVLMQGVSDQGRDVVVYSPQGKLTSIVQCKNHKKKFSAPDLRKELLKLALYNHLEPTILEDGPVSYEMWCPGGLTAHAAKVLNSWPREWTPNNLTADAADVIESYAAFNGVVWETVGAQVVDAFSKIVTPSSVENLILTEKVKQVVPIYERYFEGKIVMAKADALEAFAQSQQRLIEEVQGQADQTVQRVTRILEEAGIRPLTDLDERHLRDRIATFPKEKRLAHLTGYTMGLSHELVSRLNEGELGQFIKCSSGATMDMLHTVIVACARIASETALTFQKQVQPRSGGLSLVFLKVLSTSMSARVTGMLMGTRKLNPYLEEFAGYDLKQRFTASGRWTWESCQRCLAGFDRRVHAVGSNEETRFRIAVNALGGAATQEVFQRDLLEALEQHMAEVRGRYDAFMSLVPEQLMIVTDTVSAFENRALADRMIETTRLIERLRGLDVPE